MTPPAENAIFKPEFRLFCAACAVLALAAVAIRMPMKPERPEKKPPVTNANGTKYVKSPNPAMMNRTTNITTKKMATPAYWRFKYALAPRRTACEIFRIRSVPSSDFLTRCARNTAYKSAMTEPIGASTVSIRISCLSVFRMDAGGIKISSSVIIAPLL